MKFNRITINDLPLTQTCSQPVDRQDFYQQLWANPQIDRTTPIEHSIDFLQRLENVYYQDGEKES
ncbi:MAG: hypothetical protein QNJ72_37675 [Pleurocapsa sp. MO_226.B13]|nr:hypothetical protein [Pleurocapsa sp. MO_226.B13]